jgi:hypothetical protein
MQSKALPSEWVDRLFQRFAVIYGNRLFSNFDGIPLEDVKAAWGQELGRFDAEALKKALETLRTAHPSYPPTLYEFEALCVDALRSRSATVTKLPPPKTEIPPHIRTALRVFVEKAKGHG